MRKPPGYHMAGGEDSITVPDYMNSTILNMIVGNSGNYNSSTVCQENDFLSTYVFRPAVQATFRKFLEVCTPEVNAILPETWTLCTDNGNFNCDAIAQYASSCKRIHFDGDVHVETTTSPEPCTMGLAIQDDGAAILLLVGLVFIGILLGVALTVAVCLICPGVHRWAMTKIKGDICSKEKKVVRASTVSSEYYAAIEDNSTTNAIRLRPVQELPSPTGGPDSQLQDPRTSPLASTVGDQDFNDPVYQENGISGEHIYTDTSGGACYEHLNRNNPQVQSHKYAHIGPPDSLSPPGEVSEGHDYFTLEQTA